MNSIFSLLFSLALPLDDSVTSSLQSTRSNFTGAAIATYATVPGHLLFQHFINRLFEFQFFRLDWDSFFFPPLSVFRFYVALNASFRAMPLDLWISNSWNTDDVDDDHSILCLSFPNRRMCVLSCIDCNKFVSISTSFERSWLRCDFFIIFSLWTNPLFIRWLYVIYCGKGNEQYEMETFDRVFLPLQLNVMANGRTKKQWWVARLVGVCECVSGFTSA